MDLPIVPDHCPHNAHMYYFKLKDLEERHAFIEHLKANDIMAVFHYIPLHTAPAGQKFGEFSGKDVFTTKESERLVRLPMYSGMSGEERAEVIEKVKSFFNGSRNV